MPKSTMKGRRDKALRAYANQNEMFSAAPNSVVVDAMISANNNMVKRAWVN